MADGSQDKTEQATSRRRQEAREQGQVPYSRELVSALLLMAGLSTIKMNGDVVVSRLVEVLKTMFSLPIAVLDRAGPEGFLAELAGHVAKTVMPIMAVAMLATVVPGLILTRFSLSPKRLGLDLGKISPLKGLHKIFSMDSVVNLGSSVIKMTIVGVIGWQVISDAVPQFVVLPAQSIEAAMLLLLKLVFSIGFRVATALVVLGIIDLLYRHWKLSKDLMMTKEEVKEERKRSEGDTKVKARIRDAQRALVLQRMKTDLRRAEVVIRNPTHFAVALEYRRGKDAAPRVVAKGQDLLALNIIRMARDYGIEIVENRPLARELYRSVRLGEVVPERLFRAVAEVMAFVYGKRRKRAQSRERAAT